jgi:hypothetical protein
VLHKNQTETTNHSYQQVWIENWEYSREVKQ